MLRLKNINWVFLDLGNVLFKLHGNRTIDTLASLSPFDSETCNNIVMEQKNHMLYETGMMSTDSFMQSLIDDLKLSTDTDTVIDAWNLMLDPISKNINFMDTLARSYNLGIISNTNETHANFAIEHADLIKEQVFEFFERSAYDEA